MGNGQAGFQGKLYIGAAGAGLTAADEVVNARDVTVNLAGEVIETSTRGDAPWKTFISGWKEWSIDLTLLHDNLSDIADTLEAAYLAGTVISVKAVDDDGDGYYGDCLVENFPREEPLADAMGRSITLRGTGAVTVINAVS